MKLRRLSTRMMLFFIALLVVVQAVVFIAVTSAASGNARAKVESELDTGQKLFRRMLDQNTEQLAHSASVLAADFGFREAISTHDMGTLSSALENNGARIGADITMFVGLEGQIIAHSQAPIGNNKPFPLPQLVEMARSKGRGTSLDSLDGVAYQLVAVPVKAPLAIGYVVLGFRVDMQLSDELRSLTDLDVSFLISNSAHSHWTAIASTLPEGELKSLFDALPAGESAQQLQRLDLAHEAYQVRVLELTDVGTALPIVAVLQRSYASALVGYDRLRATLILLGFGSLALSALGAMAIALNITRPISELVNAAMRITAGDYQTPVRVRRKDELGSLADSLDHMRSGIAHRESEILRLAFRDHLTGLPNRSLFSEELNKALAVAAPAAQQVSVLVMDLDRFKYVNDTLGHGVGDHVLRQVADRISGLLQPGELVARLGGDEFAVLLPASVEHARSVAGRISKALEEPILYEGQPLDVGTSIGIAVYPEHGSNAVSLVRNADIAMYVAKRSRTGHALYDSSYDSSQQQHLSLLGELRRAVERNELRLCYQPKISLQNDTVHEVEALLRWVHPERGMVPPVEFIPFAEYTGYIKFVTHWVLREAIRQCGQWIEDGMPLRVSVNISARDLMNRDLPDQIEALLREHRVPADMMCLEITESGFMEDPAYAQQVLDTLANLGLHLSIDDYGTGYSSLSYIMKLPVNELKIDRSFVATMADNADLATIVRSTIDLGHNLGLKVVAEGVESADGLQLLKDLGCDQAQGYFVSRPLFADDLSLWLRGSGFAPLKGTVADAGMPVAATG
jgi:diguanylate cyclase (GGDEF)-like protein